MNIDFFIEKYSKLVYKICFNMLSNTKDAEDLTQETYLALYYNFNKYKDLQENEIKNIMCKIALNKCRDYLKSNFKKIENITNDEYNVLKLYNSGESIEDEIYLKENRSYLLNKINELKEPYNILIYEYYLNELSLDELAKKQGISKATLKVQLYRAKNILKEKIKKEGGDKFL